MKLKNLLIIVFSSICIAATGIVSLVADNAIQKQTSNKIEAELTAETNQLASDINGWMLGKSQAVSSIASLMSDGIASEITPTYLNQVLHTNDNEGNVSDLYIGSTDGSIIDGSFWVPDADYDSRTRPWYISAKDSDHVVFTDPYFDKASKKWAVSIAQSIKSDSGTLHGVLAMDILLDTITQRVISQKIGDSGYAFVTDSKGSFLAHKDSDLVNTNIKDLAGMEPVADAILSNESGIITSNYNGTKSIVVYKQIPSTSWIIAVTIDQNEVYAELVQSRISFILLIIFVLLIVLVVAFFAANKITKPIKLLTKSAQRAADGDLSIEISHAGSKEIRELSKAFEVMVSNIGKLVSDIGNAASLVTHSSTEISELADYTKLISDEISKTANELAIGAQSQAESASNGAEMVSNMSTAIRQISDSSKESHDMIVEVNNSVSEGVLVVDNQLSLMHQNRESTEKVGHAIALLEEKSFEIQKIVSVIGEIADQTNLLALNAAIEAARAGEHGKGFAVVAEEVRNLAEQSASSSNDIEKLLHDIQDKTLQSVEDVTAVQKIVAQQEVSLEETRCLYHKIQESVLKIVDQTILISEETNGIELHSQKVSGSIEDVAAVTEENAAATQEVASATIEQSTSVSHISEEVATLVQEAAALMEAVSSFQV
ncbi:MAG: methyl-accepting chemotaxis protein [Velocimicrobium sp.]